jgi:hypothetical protein
MDHPDDSQVIRTRVRLSGPAHDYRHGSGYLVADTVALTARHVLTSDGMADGELAGQCEVKPYGAQEWIVAEVGPSDAATDVALLRVPSVHAAASAEFGRVGNDIVDWKAVGYPSAVKDDKGRSALAPFGRVEGSSLRDRCQLQLTVEAAAPTDHHGWLGMSGAVVFAGGRVIGVIIEDAPAFDSNALRAARAEDFLKISKISNSWTGTATCTRCRPQTPVCWPAPFRGRWWSGRSRRSRLRSSRAGSY